MIPSLIAQNWQTPQRSNSPCRARQLQWEQMTIAPESIGIDESSVAVGRLRLSWRPTATKRRSLMGEINWVFNCWQSACRPKVSWWARLELLVAIVSISLEIDRGWLRLAIAGDTVATHAWTIKPQSLTPCHPGWFWIWTVIWEIGVNDIMEDPSQMSTFWWIG